MDKAAFDKLVKDAVDAELAKHEEKQKEVLRSYQVEQEKKKFKTISSKRAAGFLVDSDLDWDECFSKLNSMVGDDGDIVSLDDPSNKDKAQDFLKYFLKFGKMRQRKVKKELESYTIANNSSFGWMTESIYNQADIFKSGGDLLKGEADKKWYEIEEESPAKKVKRLFEAERQAAAVTKHKNNLLCDDDDDDDE